MLLAVTLSPARKLVFQAIFRIALLTGSAAAELASAHRRLVEVPPRYAPLALLASLVVLALWSLPRLISTSAVACCVLIAGEHARS
jgi:hypothetical protein